MDNQSIQHTRWNCTYHIVFIPKYRRKIMYCILRSRADSEAFQSGRYAEHNGRPKTLKKVA